MYIYIYENQLTLGLACERGLFCDIRTKHTIPFGCLLMLSDRLVWVSVESRISHRQGQVGGCIVLIAPKRMDRNDRTVGHLEIGGGNHHQYSSRTSWKKHVVVSFFLQAPYSCWANVGLPHLAMTGGFNIVFSGSASQIIQVIWLF